ncbi:MAG: hypothetical protein JRJ38_00950 [Deltaproteobacteria bacterium]|nr:hypothetical protein [Deltaproteobacteria bacterium]
MNKMKMREVIESGFKVTLSEENSFRFCESSAYQSLSGLSLKEMDVGWWNTTNSKLFLLELKGQEIWREFDKSEDFAYKHLVTAIKGKVTDVLLMLAAVWVKTGIGNELKAHIPNPVHQYRGEGSIKFIFLIDTPASRQSLLLPVKDAINKQLAGRVRLFGVKHVTLINFDVAQKMGLPIERQA